MNGERGISIADVPLEVGHLVSIAVHSTPFSTEEARISNDVTPDYGLIGISDDVTLDYGLIDEIFDQDTKDEWQDNSSNVTETSSDGPTGSSEAAVNHAAVGPRSSVLPCALFFCLFGQSLVIKK